MSKRPSLKPRKKPNQERSRATVEALLQAAAYILVREGYAKLTTNRVAERAGVNIASLYQYFPNKQALVAELGRRHTEAARGAVRGVMEAQRGRGLEASLRAAISAGMAAHAVNPELYRVFTEELGRHFRPDAHEDEASRAELERWVDQGWVKSPNPRLALWMLATAMHAVVHAATIHGGAPGTPQEIEDELVVMLGRYLRR